MAPQEHASQLALYGGPRVRTSPWPERGLIGLEERAAVNALFDQAIATGQAIGYNGSQEAAYCEEFATYMGGGYADAISSGTAGIYVALQALRIEPFTEVIVGAVTDPGGLMPIPLCNCIPVIADTMPGSYNVGPEQVAALISPLTSAIIVPHIAGEPADIAGIMQIAREHYLPVIEDCSQAHGATLHGQMVGTFGDVAVFSTMFGKHHSTGGQGGLIYTQDEELYHALRRAADRGKPFGLPAGSTNAIASLNLNANELGCAIGRAQLAKLPDLIAARRAVAARLADGIRDLRTVSFPALIPGAAPSYWFLRLRFHADQATCDKATFCAALAAEGMTVNPSYRAALPHMMDWYVHRRVFGNSGYPWSSPDYRGNPDQQFPCPNANAVMDIDFNLHAHESWGDAEIADAVAILSKVEAAFAK